MKPAISVLFCLLLCGALCFSVMAASETTHLDSAAIVGQDGSCAVSLVIRLHLEETVTDLTFPLPAGAKDVLLGGSFVTTHVSDTCVLAQLPNLTAGDYNFTLSYRLDDVVSRENGTAQMQIPLLSGFAYPIRSMDFSLQFPGEITESPRFFSGYHQENIASSISFTVSGNTLSGSVHEALKDHETLVLTMPVDPEMFPLVTDLEPVLDVWEAVTLTLCLLAAAYYALTLMPQLHRRSRCFSPPDGITAGEVGTCLTGTGVDLTLMVLTWAQLGYLQLEVASKRRVVLHKKMEMGNERNQTEMRAFQALFSRRSSVDGTGVHYAKLYRKLRLQTPLTKQLFKPNSGSPMIFRALSCAAGGFSAVNLGLAMTEHSVGRVLLAVLACLCCGIFSYFIQNACQCLPLRNKLPMALGLGCAGVWIALGAMTGQLGVAAPMVIFQAIFGLGIAFGGRRSERGKRSMSDLLGLRHYMLHANTFELQQRLTANSNYFFELAPYALALGVDRRFARRFGKAKMPECGFVVTRQDTPVTATQWANLLRQITEALNIRQRKLPYERITKG